MKKFTIAASVFLVMALVIGVPSHVMAGVSPPGECEDESDCEDGFFCTTDECVSGMCVNRPDDNQCDDSDECTTDTCDPGSDCQHETIDCDDGIDCTVDSCDEENGCEHQPDNFQCDDSISCTADTCDPVDSSADSRGCTYAPDDSKCDDADDCTTDTCDLQSGCLNPPIDCDDGSPCTEDSCDSGMCVNTPDCSADPSCDLGSGPGCSAIGGVDAETIMAGSCFEGKIGTTGVSGVNPNGKPAKDSDGDGCTDSLEKCINSSLVGYCTDVDVNDCDSDPGDDGEDILYTPGDKEGKKQSQQYFQVVFQSGPCAISECSDKMDNDGDGKVDYGKDPQCASFSDDDESTAGEQ